MNEEFPASGPHAEVLRILDHSVRCSICYSLYDAPLALRACGHSFCSGCIRQNLDFQEKSGQPHCPSCRATCDARDLQPNVALREVVDRYKAARKSILSLMQDASEIEEKKQIYEVQEVEVKEEKQEKRAERVHGRRRREITADQQQAAGATAAAGKTECTREGGTKRRSSRRSIAGKEEEEARKASIEPSPSGNQGPRTRKRAAGGEGSYDGGGGAPGGSGSGVPVAGSEEKPTATTTTTTTKAAAAAAVAVGTKASPKGTTKLLDRSDADFCIEILSSSSSDEGESSDPEFTGVEEESPSPPAAKKAKRQQPPSSQPQQKGKGAQGSQNPGPSAASDTPSGFVKCPICTKSVPSFYINSHVDQCLLASTNSQAAPQPDNHKVEEPLVAAAGGGGGGGAAGSEEQAPLLGHKSTHNQQQQQQTHQVNNNSQAGPSTSTAPFQPLSVPHKLVATLVSEKQLRTMLKRYDVPSEGKKAELLDRYNRFRLAVETANDRQERTTYARLAQRLVVLDKRKAAASLLGMPSNGGGGGGGCGGGGARLHGGSKADNSTFAAATNNNNNNISSGDGLIEMGSSYKQLIAVCRARDAARKAARQAAAAAAGADAPTTTTTAASALDNSKPSEAAEPINVRSLFHRAAVVNNDTRAKVEEQAPVPSWPDNSPEQLEEEKETTGKEEAGAAELPPQQQGSEDQDMQPAPTVDQDQGLESDADIDQETGQEQEQAHPNSMPQPDPSLIQPSPASCGRRQGSQRGSQEQVVVAGEVEGARDVALGDSEDEVW